MVQLLSREEVASLLDKEGTIDTVEEAFHRMDEAVVPSRVQIKKENPPGEVFVMPGFIDPKESPQELGLKTATIFPENDNQGIPRTLGTIQLHSTDTGRVQVIMDGAHITNYRTGAIGAVAGRYFARDNATVAGIFGSSTVGRHQAIMLDTELDLEYIRIYSRSDLKYDAVANLQDRLSAEVVAADSPRATCYNSDIVVTATPSSEPVFPADVISNGTLVISVGSNDSSMREIPGEIMSRAERVFVDDYDHCLRVGDIQGAINEGHLLEENVEPFSNVVKTSNRKQKDRKAIYAVKSVGSIVFDILVSKYVLQQANESDAGINIDLHDITES